MTAGNGNMQHWMEGRSSITLLLERLNLGTGLRSDDQGELPFEPDTCPSSRFAQCIDDDDGYMHEALCIHICPAACWLLWGRRRHRIVSYMISRRARNLGFLVWRIDVLLSLQSWSLPFSVPFEPFRPARTNMRRLERLFW